MKNNATVMEAVNNTYNVISSLLYNDNNLVPNNNLSDWADVDFSKVNYSDDLTIWIRRPIWEVTIKALVIIPIMALGLIGNSAIIYIILRIKQLRDSTVNLFILNMAIADFLTTLFCPWMALVDNVYQNYELGPVLCRFEGSFKILCMLVSAFSLITLSCDRFFVTVYPFNRHLNKKASYLIMLAIWILAIIIATPLAVWRTYRERQFADFLEKWCPEEHLEQARAYWLFLLAPLIYVPLTVMIVVYSVILVHMDRYEKTLTINETQVKVQHRQTVTKMLFLYIMTTIICWLPLQILVYYRHYKVNTTFMPNWWNNVCLIAQLFASANAAINPIVTFRKTFAHLLPKIFRFHKGTNKISPLELKIIKHHIDIARPSLASDGSHQLKQIKIISNGFNSNTTSHLTKEILKERVPEIYMGDDT